MEWNWIGPGKHSTWHRRLPSVLLCQIQRAQNANLNICRWGNPDDAELSFPVVEHWAPSISLTDWSNEGCNMMKHYKQTSHAVRKNDRVSSALPESSVSIPDSNEGATHQLFTLFWSPPNRTFSGWNPTRKTSLSDVALYDITGGRHLEKLHLTCFQGPRTRRKISQNHKLSERH